MEYPRVEPFDAGEVVRRIDRAGGPRLEVVRPLGSGANGAWEVRRESGASSVLTWAAPLTRGSETNLDRCLALVRVARDLGVPAPAYQEIIGLPGGDAAVLQELAPGVPVERPTAQLVDALLEMCDRRREALADTGYADETSSLHLLRDGPGYCLHWTLRQHGSDTRGLLERIEAIGARPLADTLAGTDLVHFDYHLSNVLVHPDDPNRLTAIVDWGGARPGDISIDLVTLLLNLTIRAKGSGLDQLVDRHLQQNLSPDDLERFWAHGILRAIDWNLRHSPEMLGHWLMVAERHLPG